MTITDSIKNLFGGKKEEAFREEAGTLGATPGGAMAGLATAVRKGPPVEEVQAQVAQAKGAVARLTAAEVKKVVALRKKEGLFRRLSRMYEERKTDFLVALMSGSAALGMLLLNIFYVMPSGQTFVFSVLNILIGTTLLVPITMTQYYRYRSVREAEDRFPDFLRDVVEGIRGGMTLPLAINNAARNRYGALTPIVNKLVSQISWGVPFESALENFAVLTKSKVVARSVSTIIEAHRSGGDIAEVLASLGTATVEIDKIRRERISRIYAQMTTGYIIYFIFIGVMVGMQKFLIPALAGPGFAPGAGVVTAGIAPVTPLNLQTLNTQFAHLSLIQGGFAGLAIGKMAEGTIFAGIKHSIVLALVGYTALTLVA